MQSESLEFPVTTRSAHSCKLVLSGTNAVLAYGADFESICSLVLVSDSLPKWGKSGTKTIICSSNSWAGYYLLPLICLRSYRAATRLQQDKGEHVLGTDISSNWGQPISYKTGLMWS